MNVREICESTESVIAGNGSVPQNALRRAVDLPEERTEERTKTHACDCISREAAQKLICEDGTRLEKDGVYELTMCAVKQWAVDLLDELPSVEPEKCGDCISRTELLKKQQIIIDEHGLEHKIVHIGKIIDAPSVEPERKPGKWENTIFNRTAMVKCSICGGLDLCHADFCHWCGADMREVQESEEV